MPDSFSYPHSTRDTLRELTPSSLPNTFSGWNLPGANGLVYIAVTDFVRVAARPHAGLVHFLEALRASLASLLPRLPCLVLGFGFPQEPA